MESERNKRTLQLVGEEGMNKIKNSAVLIFGIGGVGGYIVEALVRAGIGTVGIVDGDTVSESNINRQIIATYESVGRNKTEAMKERIHIINPECKVIEYKGFYPSEVSPVFGEYDYIVDAVDQVAAKIRIIEEAKTENLPVISSMGTGNKLHADFKVVDISKTKVCPLARVMRKELKKRDIKNVKVLYSEEEPVIKKRTPASISYVPAVAGLQIAGEIIRDLIL